MQILAGQPGLHGFAGKFGRNRLEDAKHARDRYQLSIKFLAEHPRGQVAGVIDDLPSCTDLISRIMHEAEDVLDRLAAP